MTKGQRAWNDWHEAWQEIAKAQIVQDQAAHDAAVEKMNTSSKDIVKYPYLTSNMSIKH